MNGDLRLGHVFASHALLDEALTHPSVMPADRGVARHGYQRFEFLGDRVLSLLIAEWLLERFDREPEGALARRHAVLVAADSLARVAKAIDLAPHIRMSPAEIEQGGRDKPAILADVCEAVIAAIYLDAGLPAARRFVRSHWVELVEEDIRPPKDPKTALQEWAQARSLPLPSYRQVDRTGPDHAPLFTVEVSVAGSEPGSGLGASKRLAERAAAEALLGRLKGEIQ